MQDAPSDDPPISEDVQRLPSSSADDSPFSSVGALLSLSTAATTAFIESNGAPVVMEGDNLRQASPSQIDGIFKEVPGQTGDAAQPRTDISTGSQSSDTGSDNKASNQIGNKSSDERDHQDPLISDAKDPEMEEKKGADQSSEDKPVGMGAETMKDDSADAPTNANANASEGIIDEAAVNGSNESNREGGIHGVSDEELLEQAEAKPDLSDDEPPAKKQKTESPTTAVAGTENEESQDQQASRNNIEGPPDSSSKNVGSDFSNENQQDTTTMEVEHQVPENSGRPSEAAAATEIDGKEDATRSGEMEQAETSAPVFEAVNGQAKETPGQPEQPESSKIVFSVLKLEVPVSTADTEQPQSSSLALAEQPKEAPGKLEHTESPADAYETVKSESNVIIDEREQAEVSIPTPEATETQSQEGQGTVDPAHVIDPVEPMEAEIDFFTADGMGTSDQSTEGPTSNSHRSSEAIVPSQGELDEPMKMESTVENPVDACDNTDRGEDALPNLSDPADGNASKDILSTHQEVKALGRTQIFDDSTVEAIASDSKPRDSEQQIEPPSTQTARPSVSDDMAMSILEGVKGAKPVDAEMADCVGNGATEHAGDVQETDRPVIPQDRLASNQEGATATNIPKKPDGNSSIQKKTPKHTRSKNMDPKILEIRRAIQLGCRENDLASAIKAYEEAIANNIKVEAQTFYNLLNLCDGLERAVHVGTPKTTGSKSGDLKPSAAASEKPMVDSKIRQEYVFRIKDHMSRLNLPLNETAYTAMVKVLVRNKEYVKAQDILQEAESVQQCRPKLRMYASLLAAYCEDRRMIDALKCWMQLSVQKLDLSERESSQLLRCALGTGDALVFQRVLGNIAEEITIPSKETVAAVLEWHETAHGMYTAETMRVAKRADQAQVKNLLQEIHKDEIETPPNMGPIICPKGWNVSSAIPIDIKTGTLQGGCLDGCRLQPASLSDRAWEEMRQMNETIVLEGQVEGNTSQFQGGRKGKIRNDFDQEERKARWKRFTDFLDTMGAIDVVIDAANVGYFKQNFSNAPRHVDYEQIDWTAKHFMKMDKKVLLILHQRHFNPKLMPDKFRYIQNEWERQGILYKTPPGMNDDWFWMDAALKYRTLVLTNDEMRDHHFQMLSPRTFLRWKERHQVHFNFGDWLPVNGSGGHQGRDVELEFPPVYSRRIQRVDDGLVVPLIKRGDENRFLDGSHIADSDEPKEETYVCIRPTNREARS